MYRTTRKALIGFVLFAVGIPVFYYSLSYATKPTLHDGDRLEVRSCRQCGGTGEDGDPGGVFPDGGGACPFCRGAGEVDVIVPGPNRPTRIWGATIAGDRIGVFDLYAIAPGCGA
ncbi:MAG: hypothetical protein ACE5GW_08150 [Planctomycetota bacterium]